MIFLTAHLSPSRCQVQIDDDRSFRLMHAIDEAVGLGRIVRRAQLEDELVLVAEDRSPADACACADPRNAAGGHISLPSRTSGTRPFSKVSGVPHSLVTSVSWPRCHQAS